MLPLSVSNIAFREGKISVIDDVLKVLDRIPIWKRLQEVPAEVDELKAKVIALEEQLNGKRPPDVCPFCGARSFRLQDVILHGKMERWKCQAADCGKGREVPINR